MDESYRQKSPGACKEVDTITTIWRLLLIAQDELISNSRPELTVLSPLCFLPEAEYKSILIKVGLPEVVAELLANSDTGASSGALFGDRRQLGTLIGRATTSLTTAIAAVL
ncbi:MAG: hypothetical protein PHF56_23065 [Desulfuromonadaceae bacterium]|nr:hypothetical protein [Desulfuromonadaceae bacterium]